MQNDIVFLGLGSNIGDRQRFIERAITELAAICTITAASSLYETTPIGPRQRKFLNCVISVTTTLTPEQLLIEVKRIERQLGRQQRQHWGPREIDIDILLCGDIVLWSPILQIPHQELLHRAFVVTPLLEIAPEVVHPVFHRPIAKLYR